MQFKNKSYEKKKDSLFIYLEEYLAILSVSIILCKQMDSREAAFKTDSIKGKI